MLIIGVHIYLIFVSTAQHIQVWEEMPTFYSVPVVQLKNLLFKFIS